MSSLCDLGLLDKLNSRIGLPQPLSSAIGLLFPLLMIYKRISTLNDIVRDTLLWYALPLYLYV